MSELPFMRPLGKIEHDGKSWKILEAAPHIRQMLKNVFLQIPKTAVPPYVLAGGPQIDAKIAWFMQMYPLEISTGDRERMAERKTLFETTERELAAVMSEGWQPSTSVGFRGNQRPYRHQAQVAELAQRLGRILIGDEMGLGKTISAIASVVAPQFLPALVVPQVHLVTQWAEKIAEFTTLSTHALQRTKPYELPRADIYICPYTKLGGWIDYAATAGFKSVIFDEVHELRAGTETAKGKAAKAFADVAEMRVGLSGTPVFNYGDEIFRIVDGFLEEGALGTWEQFLTEWCKAGREVVDPPALGSYLQSQHLLIARTREDVGDNRARPNIVVQKVKYDPEAMAEHADPELMRKLAEQVVSGSWQERGQASRDFDLRLRQATGIAKAPFVAGFAKMLLATGEPIILAGWHRAVYDIWLRELADFNPVMFTGSETPRQKRLSKEAFLDGYSDVFIMSLLSGAGLDGLQARCKTVVVGELAWSNEIHRQLIARADRPGQKSQVDAFYVVADGGSDPNMMSVLGVKSSQAHGIIRPFEAPRDQHSDESRIKALAQAYIAGDVKISPRRSKPRPAPVQSDLF